MMCDILVYMLLVSLLTQRSSGLRLTGSSYAVLDQTFRFTCDQTGSATGTTLSFMRDGGAVCTIAFPLDSTQCQQFTASPGYSCSCGQNRVYYMDISSVGTQDEDTWDCQLGTVTSAVTSLPVYYGPRNVAIDKTSPVTVIEGVTTGSARCSADCKPGCSYTWRKGSQQVSGSQDLNLGSLTRGQEGDYTCTAVNTINTDTKIITVNIRWYPAQPTHTCPTWIVLGQTGSCTCQPSDRGNPAGIIQWRNPAGQTVSSSQSASVSLNLSSIPRSDNNKNYICRAGNSLTNSNKDTPYSVNIAFGPTGVSITGNQPTSAPDVLTLTCTTTDHVNPAPTLTWKNSTSGDVLSGTSPVTVGSAQDGGYVYRSTLSITTQWYQDGDTIVCEGRNPQIQSQQAVTDSIVLDVNYPPQSAPVIYVIPSSPVYEGDSVTLTCRVTGGKPLVITVTLTCPGDHQSSTTTTEGSDTRVTTLTFPATRELRSQPCRCSAAHSTGRYQLTADVSKDDVFYPPSKPTITSLPLLPWQEGMLTVLICQSTDTGYPPASYRWYKDAVLIQESSLLEFPTVTHEDNMKTVYCEASNYFTEHTGKPARSNPNSLIIHYPPVISLEPSSPQKIQTGSNIELNCSAKGNPGYPSVAWYFGDVQLSRGQELTITSATKKDSGIYTCCASVTSATFGNLTSTASVVVKVVDVPSSPKNFYCINHTDSGVTLHWKSSDPPSDNVTFILERKSSDETNFTHLQVFDWHGIFKNNEYEMYIGNLRSSSLYFFRLQIENAVGISEADVASCFTLQGIQLHPLCVLK